MEKNKVIDLTHSVSGNTPTWDGSCGFLLETKTDYQDCTAPDLFRIQSIQTKAGIGTHIDSPAHCIPNGRTADELILSELISDCVIIDVSSKADEKYIITIDDVFEFEKQHAIIEPDTFVLFYTGWGKYWADKEKYRNNLSFPTVHPDVVKYLLEKNISGLGTDTLSADNGSNGFPVHRLILGANKYLLENVGFNTSLPKTGFKIGIFPMKIEGATEAPARVVAFL